MTGQYQQREGLSDDGRHRSPVLGGQGHVPERLVWSVQAESDPRQARVEDQQRLGRYRVGLLARGRLRGSGHSVTRRPARPAH